MVYYNVFPILNNPEYNECLSGKFLTKYVHYWKFLVIGTSLRIFPIGYKNPCNIDREFYDDFYLFKIRLVHV